MLDFFAIKYLHILNLNQMVLSKLQLNGGKNQGDKNEKKNFTKTTNKKCFFKTMDKDKVVCFLQ